MKITRSILIVTTLLAMFRVYGQYPLFNVNQSSNMIVVIPAIAGEERCTRIGLNQVYQHSYMGLGHFSSLTTFDRHID